MKNIRFFVESCPLCDGPLMIDEDAEVIYCDAIGCVYSYQIGESEPLPSLGD